MSAAGAPLGRALYFVDVLACLLFCLTLALIGARFGREVTVPVELPRLPAGAAPGSDLTGLTLVVREADGRLELFLGDEPVSFEELEARLASAPPPSLVVRAEASALARVIGAAHTAGVHDIQLAYDASAPGGP